MSVERSNIALVIQACRAAASARSTPQMATLVEYFTDELEKSRLDLEAFIDSHARTAHAQGRVEALRQVVNVLATPEQVLDRLARAGYKPNEEDDK